MVSGQWWRCGGPAVIVGGGTFLCEVIVSSSTDSTYDFAAPAAREPAPESGGAPKPAAPDTHEPQRPRQKLAERPCPQCGFLIVGTPRKNRCPECRAPLDDSLADLLQFSDSAWIRRVSWGVLAVALAVPAHGGGAWLGFQHDLIRGSALQVLGAGLTLAGVWQITSREIARPQKHALLALAARWLALAAAVLWIGATVVASRQGAIRWLAVPALAAMAGEAVALGLFASRLAERIPHDGLTNQLRNFALLLPLFFGFLVLAQFYDLTELARIFFCALPLIGALAGLLLWVLATLLRFFLELRQAAVAADAIVRKHFQAAETAARAAAARDAQRKTET